MKWFQAFTATSPRIVWASALAFSPWYSQIAYSQLADVAFGDGAAIVSASDLTQVAAFDAYVPPPVPAVGTTDSDEDDVPRFLRDNLAPPILPGGVRLHAERIQFDPSVPEDHAPPLWHLSEGFAEALTTPAEPLAYFVERLTHSHHDHVKTGLTPYPIGIRPVPSRPNLPIELNEEFLAPGFLKQGIETPFGAIWRPSIWVFGTSRTGYSYTDSEPGATVSEFVTRLDLFGQLNLSGTERVVVGLRPFDKETAAGRTFTAYDVNDGRFIDGVNADIQTLFFEGDFGEIFPRLDPYDALGLDIGFSIGRQPLSFQQGLLINEDRADAVTVTRNTLNGDGNLNLRMTGVMAWDEIHRNNNQFDPSAQLVGLFTESDFRWATVNADIAYVDSETNLGSLLAFGLSAIKRIHGYENTYNASMHVLGSVATDGETAASGDGVLLFGQTSWTPHHTKDLVYLNGFWAIDQFTSPARGPLAGGPLGQTGILFAASGLGRVGPPLSNQATDVVGASLGYQLFFNDTREQVIFEIGGRQPTNNADGAIAVGARLQRALGQHWIAILDTFVAKQESQRTTPGARLEFLMKF